MRSPVRPILTHVLVALVAFGAGVSLRSVAAADVSEGRDPAVGTLVVQNTYFPRPGAEEEVLATRLEASAVRAAAGLSTGRVMRRVDGPDDAPYLMWEAEYENAEARAADVAALDQTDFSRVSSHMGTLLDGFARTVWEVVEQE